MTGFYPTNAVVPAGVSTERLLLRPLTVDHVAIDYDAVMASKAQLRVWSDTTWPTDNFTLAENRADLERHQREHDEGVAFTYTVLAPDEQRCLGCVYITPIPAIAAYLYAKDGPGAKVTFWIRSDLLGSGAESHLLESLQGWFAGAWPFNRLVYTVSRGNHRQAQLLEKKGFVCQATLPLPDGRPVRFYAK